MTHSWQELATIHSGHPGIANHPAGFVERRATERRAVALPARLAWKDQRGVNRFASVVTRDISAFGVFVESVSPLSIPLYRLVQFQIEPTSRAAADLPDFLKQPRILSAVYRVAHGGRNSPHGLALRLLIDPARAASLARDRARATA